MSESDDQPRGMSRTSAQPQKSELPPRPGEVLDDDRVEYQAMTDLTDDDYRSLAEDIRERGVLQPIITDENGTILDGHHRAAIAEYYDLDGSRQPSYVVIGDLDSDGDKLARAIKQNVIGRDTGGDVKTHAIKQYIETTWDRTDDGALIRTETDTEVAAKLGVDHSLVSRVVRNWNSPIVDHDRMKAREYYEDNPDASYREVARQVDSAKTTVTKWLKEDFDEGDGGDDGDDEQPTLAATVTDRGEAEKAADVFKRSQDDEGTDPDIREEAEENAERLARGETSATTASKNVEMVEADKEVEEDRNPDPKHEYDPAVTEADARVWLNTEAPDADVLVTDPPYTTDVDDIGSFVRSWVPDALDTVKRDGYAYIFVGSYADELEAYLTATAKTEWYVQPLVWHYRNTLGQSPNNRYKRDWQAVFYCRGPEAGSLNAPRTSELRSVQEFNAPGMFGDDGDRHHRWQKPRPLVEQYVRHGSEQGDVIIDPFSGSGEVLLAAADVGRDAYGCDLDTDAVATAVERGCVKRD